MKLFLITILFLLIVIVAYGLTIYKMVKTGKIRAKGAKKRRAVIYALIGFNKLFPKKKKKKKEISIKEQLA